MNLVYVEQINSKRIGSKFCAITFKSNICYTWTNSKKKN